MRNFETTEVFEFTCNKCGKEVDCSMVEKENKTVIYVRECPCVTEIITEQEARIAELESMIKDPVLGVCVCKSPHSIYSICQCGKAIV